MSAPGDPWNGVRDRLDEMNVGIERDLHRAKPYLDAHVIPGKWLPSTALGILWCAAYTDVELQLMGSNTAQLNRAIERANRCATIIDQKLQLARERYRAGYYANPFDDPVPRLRMSSSQSPSPTQDDGRAEG